MLLTRQNEVLRAETVPVQVFPPTSPIRNGQWLPEPRHDLRRVWLDLCCSGWEPAAGCREHSSSVQDGNCPNHWYTISFSL